MAGGSTITGFRINQLTDVQNPLTGLGNAYFEVEVPLGPVAGAYTNLRLRGDRLMEWIAASPSNQSDWNNKKNPYKIPQNRADRDTIPLDSLCLLTVANYTNPGPGEPKADIVLYTDYQAGVTFKVHRDGRFDGTLADAAWYPVDSPEAGVPAYSQLSPAYSAGPPLSGYAFAVDELVRAFVPGSTTEQFAARRAPGGPAPAPTAALLDFSSSPDGADPNWRFVGRGAVPPPNSGPVGNAAPFPVKVVSTLAERAALNPFTLCLETVCLVAGLPDSDPNKRTVLRYTPHSADTIYVCKDGRYDANDLTDADWYPAPSYEGAIPLTGTTPGNPLHGVVEVSEDNGFLFSSPDGSYLLQITSGVLQVLDPVTFDRYFTISAAGFGGNKLQLIRPDGIGVAVAVSNANTLTIDGVPVVSYVTANDIEITDPAKGVIMTVGSTRVRARIAGTAGARTWTFTEL